MNQLSPNAMIQGRFLIVQTITEAPSGETYLAVDQRMGKAVALKRTSFEQNTELASTFEGEAAVLARLDHPVLPKVIEHFIDDNGHFLVIEHISGDDLAKRSESAEKPLPLSWVMFWADQLLDALQYLHSHVPPIVHRGVTPQNLKLTDDNHVVLLGCLLPSEGTIPGVRPDIRDDIFAISATLYQLMTNTVPVSATDRTAALMSKRADPLSSLFELNREVPAGISTAILKGLALNPGDRFQTAVEMQRDLRRMFNSDQTEAKTAVFDSPAFPPDDQKTMDGMVDETIQMSTPPIPIQSNVQTEVLSVPAPVDVPAAVAEPAASELQAVTPVGFESQITQAAQPKKRSSSKAGLIIGVLAVLFVVAAAAVGGGLYLYSAYYAAPAEPPVTITENPLPSPSPEPTAVAEVENDNTNTGSSDLEDPFGENSNSRVKSAPAGTEQPRTVKAPAREPQPRSTQPSAPRSTPKVQTKDHRTDIEQ